MSTATGLELSNTQKYISLETYRKDGTGVRTPVWFALSAVPGGEPRLYVYTVADSGKAKRLRRSGTVRIATCDARGRITGAWIDASATMSAADFDLGMTLLNRKYRPWKQILDLSVRLFPRHQRVMIVITRSTSAASAT